LIELVIIADDLTGAIDTGVQLAKQGISTTISIEPDVQVEQLISTCDAQIMVFNTESRHIDQIQAANRVKNVIKKSKKAGITRFYKKTDSTMRGNIGAELEAFLSETGQRTLPFIPAHPKLKRFTKNGYHYINQQSLHETEFGHDPLEPIKTSYIPELLHQQAQIPIHIIDIEKYQHRPEDSGMLVFDCASENDLEKIGNLLFAHELNRAISGSAAMAELLPAFLKLKPKVSDRMKLDPPSLIVNGSLNKISYLQVIRANEHGVKTLCIPEELFGESILDNNPHLIRIISEIRSEISTGKSVILNSTNLENLESAHVIQAENPATHHENISEKIGIIVAVILNKIHINTLMVIGGDTLLGVMRAIGGISIEPISEIIPGVAISMVKGKNDTIQLITKPGGYGEKDVILHLLTNINKQDL